MNISITNKAISELSKYELDACFALNFGEWGGSMYRRLQRGLDQADDSYYAVMAKDERGEILGWSLVFPDYTETSRYDDKPTFTPNAYFFVDPNVRGLGIGKRLVEAVISCFPYPTFHPFDEKSARLFMPYIGRFYCPTYRLFWLQNAITPEVAPEPTSVIAAQPKTKIAVTRLRKLLHAFSF